jgi:hypothetical protein
MQHEQDERDSDETSSPLPLLPPPLPYESKTNPAPKLRGASTRTRVVRAAVGGAVGVVGGFVLIASQTVPCHGGTRSVRLKWDQRQAEIDQTLAEQGAALPAPVGSRDGA